LKLPEYNRKTENAVTVGWLYWKKLEQQSSYKISSRSIGKYSESTGQATAGSKQGGGQRLGEFDTWAIAAHGAETVLKELLGPLADSRSTKDEILFDIIQNGEAAYREPKSGTTKNLLNIYMAGMMLDVKV
jgi:DNA-directed RNA polymerase beta subunit